MTLREAFGKNVRVTFKDGAVMEGHVNAYTSDVDNEPDPESICIGDFELFAPEIECIEPLVE
jgi:hypothetical protein